MRVKENFPAASVVKKRGDEWEGSFYSPRRPARALKLGRMNRKRIIVMGFMASCPIAGVVWQHVHYIVGLGHGTAPAFSTAEATA